MAFAKLLEVLNHGAFSALFAAFDGWRDFGKERWCKFIRLLHIEILECWNIRCKYRHLHLATHRLVDVTTPLSTAAQLHPPNYDFNSHTCTDNFNLSVPMSQPTLYVYEEKLSNNSHQSGASMSMDCGRISREFEEQVHVLPETGPS
jgi:hypothetical protein